MRASGDIAKGLAGYAYPNGEPSGVDRFLRRWIVRCERALPPQMELDELAARLSERVEAIVRETYASHVSEERLEASATRVGIAVIGAKHCAVAIESPGSTVAVGDTAAIGTWVVIRGVDDAYAIEDLEGLPRHFWFQLGS